LAASVSISLCGVLLPEHGSSCYHTPQYSFLFVA
jgi:hypothetical protein